MDELVKRTRWTIKNTCLNRAGELVDERLDVHIRLACNDAKSLGWQDGYNAVLVTLSKLRSKNETLRSQLDLWKRQAAFESEHREKYRQRSIECARQLEWAHEGLDEAKQRYELALRESQRRGELLYHARKDAELWKARYEASDEIIDL